MNILIEMDKTFSALSKSLDRLELENLEVEESDGKLVISLNESIKLIVSRQSASNQIWLAEPNGGWKFDLKEGEWIDTKRNLSLQKALSDLIFDVLRIQIEL